MNNEIEKAIEILKTLYVKSCKMANGRLVGGQIDSDKAENRAINLAISALEKQLNGGWIPVKERLPAEYGSYLVAWRPIDSTAENIMEITVSRVSHFYEIVEYDPDDEALWIGGIEHCKEYEILAWQELPEPWKDVENE